MDENERLALLEKRLGRIHARMRLGIERVRPRCPTAGNSVAIVDGI